MTGALSFDDVREGGDLASVCTWVTQETINRYAEASGDFNPLHVDPEFAKTTVYRGAIAHGLFPLAYISEMMTRAFGRGWLEGGTLSVTFIAPIRPGEIVAARGVVKEKREEDAKRIVICEVFCETLKGEMLVSGQAAARC